MDLHRVAPGFAPFGRLSPALLFLALWVSFSATAAHGQDWETRFDEAGVVVETRPMAGSRFRAFRGRTQVDASPEEVLRRLQDIDAYPLWFPDTTEASAVLRENGRWANYVRTAAPWPVKDRDAVYVSRMERAANNIRIDVFAAPELAPERDDAVRIRDASGYWLLEAEGSGTRITWEFHVEPGGNVPSSLANARVVATPRGALEALRAYFAKIDEPRGQN
ncbi:MAG: START domain-containing protein [Pseudomonadota bacterium]